MRKFNNREVVSWRYIIWGNSGGFSIEMPMWCISVEDIISHAMSECKVREYNNIWVEIVGEDENGDLVCAEDVFKYNRRRIMMLDKKRREVSNG